MNCVWMLLFKILAIQIMKFQTNIVNRGGLEAILFKRNFLWKKAKLVLNSLTVRYFNWGYVDCKHDLKWLHGPLKNFRQFSLFYDLISFYRIVSGTNKCKGFETNLDAALVLWLLSFASHTLECEKIRKIFNNKVACPIEKPILVSFKFSSFHGDRK